VATAISLIQEQVVAPMTDPPLRSTAESGRFYPVANVRFEHGGPLVYGRLPPAYLSYQSERPTTPVSAGKDDEDLGRLRDQRAISRRSLSGGWLTLLQPGGKAERVMGIEHT
jgi:hypothetical protein